MKISVKILFLMRFVYPLKADEDGNLDESKLSLEDYSSIELAIIPSEVTTEKEKKLDRDSGIISIDNIFNRDDLNTDNSENIVAHHFAAYLKDPSSDEVYKATKISIEYKDSSTEKKSEKENKKPVESKKYTDSAGKSQGSIHKNVTETNDTDSNEHNTNLNEKKIDSTHSKNFNEKSKNTEHEDDKKVVSEILKSITPVIDTTKSSYTSEPTRKSSTIDYMDDLIFTDDLEKSRENYDGVDNDSSLSPETQFAHDESELDGLDQDFRPSRRMFDPVPVLDNKGRFEGLDLLEPINPSRRSLGPGLNPANIFPQILLPNRLDSVPNRMKSVAVMPSNLKTPHGISQEILINPNKFDNYEEVENDPMRFVDSREVNSREILFGPSKFNNVEESMGYIPDRFGISQEMLRNPNRMAQEYPKISFPRRIGQPPKTYNLPNRWIPYMTTIPNIWLQTPGLPNIPLEWVHPRPIYIPNGFNPLTSDQRIIQSQESYDLQDFETNAIQTDKYNPLDSNAYPYFLAKNGKLDDLNMNPIFRKLAQASHINQQLPMYGILSYPGYQPFDTRLMAQRNFAFIPRFRRFSTGNGVQSNRMCCY